jgi:enamine deaminase RidA (YjgF/YER057c/UK114 family)
VPQLKINSARRLFRIVGNCQQQTSLPVGQALCEAIGVKTNGLSEQAVITLGMDAIVKMRALIDDVEKGMSNNSNASMHVRTLNELRHVFTGTNMGNLSSNTWASLVATNALTSLELMAEVLPHDSDESEAEDIFKLLDAINELIAAFDSSSLPPLHAHYARLILNTLKKALLEYAFVGTPSLRACIATVEGMKSEIGLQREIMAEEVKSFSETQSTLFQKLDKIYVEVAEHAKRVYYIGGAIALGGHVVSKLALPLFE